jgi:bacterioferritin-associated ferredoxin
MYVCLCNAITDRELCAHAESADLTVSMVYRSLGAKPKCGKCVPYVRRLLQQLIEVPLSQSTATALV